MVIGRVCFYCAENIKKNPPPPFLSSAGLEDGLQTTAVTRQKRCLTSWTVKDVKIILT